MCVRVGVSSPVVAESTGEAAAGSLRPGAAAAPRGASRPALPARGAAALRGPARLGSAGDEAARHIGRVSAASIACSVVQGARRASNDY